MALRVVGAGLGRTGTKSLKEALELLLGEPCYHMAEVFAHPEHIEFWQRAADGEAVDWDEVFDGYAAAVDWPMASFWSEIAEAYPDAIILHSTRADSDTWFQSVNRTILRPRDRDLTNPFERMADDVIGKVFDGEPSDRDIAIAGYECHNAHVLANAPADRLLRYQPGDGWEPLCEALGVAVPDVPYPHTNTTEQFRERFGLDS